MEKVQAVIFDWGGVLIEDPAPGLVRYCSNALGVSEKRYRNAYSLCMDDFHIGRFSEEQFWTNMTSRLSVPMPELKSLWADAFADAYVPKPRMFHLAARLRKIGCKVALLSNTEMPSVEFFGRQNYDVFDVTVFSCVENTKKPESRIYEITLNRLAATPANSLFVDDRPECIDGAACVGLHTILFENVDQFEQQLSKFIPSIRNE